MAEHLAHLKAMVHSMKDTGGVEIPDEIQVLMMITSVGDTFGLDMEDRAPDKTEVHQRVLTA